MAVGKVKWFNDEKGWGFIKQETGPDVFVHYSQISGEGRRRLFEDETVEFEIKEGPKGLQAVNVIRMQGAGDDGRKGGPSHFETDRGQMS
jgi:cold shock protein